MASRRSRKKSPKKCRLPSAGIAGYFLTEAEGVGGSHDEEEDMSSGGGDDFIAHSTGDDGSLGDTHRALYWAQEQEDFVSLPFPEEDPFFPVELAVPNEETWKFDFSRRLYDLPSTLRYDLVTDEKFPEPKEIETFDELDQLIRDALDQMPQRQDHHSHEKEADQLDKKDVFMNSGSSLKDRIVSGIIELDINLAHVRLDCFENVMVLGSKATSDVSPQFTHGWPRRLVTEQNHGGFLAGNITCTAKVTNTRIRSMARGDVAAFVSTDEIRGSGMSLSELLYCRKAAIACNRESYQLPARLIDSSVRYGMNFATMECLEPAEIQRLAEKLFIPYWSRTLLADSADTEENTADSRDDEIVTVNRAMAMTLTAVKCSGVDVQLAVHNLRKNFTTTISHRPTSSQPRTQPEQRTVTATPETTESSRNLRDASTPKLQGKRKRKAKDPRQGARAVNALEKQLPAQIRDRIVGAIHYDKLPSEQELSEIFEFMKKHKPLLQTEDFQTESVRQSLHSSTTRELNDIWSASRRECTCVGDDSERGGCSVRNSEGPFDDQTIDAVCPQLEECVPCTFVKKVRQLRSREPLTLNRHRASIFRQRLLLAEPLSELIDHVDTAVGVGTPPSRRLKEVARVLVDCEERFLLTVRKVGRLVRICPQLSTVRLTSGLGSFWKIAEIISRSVYPQENEFLRQHSLGRIKLSLAVMALNDAGDRQKLEDWFHYFRYNDEAESSLWREHLLSDDLWSAARKIAQGSNNSQTDDDVPTTARASSVDQPDSPSVNSSSTGE